MRRASVAATLLNYALYQTGWLACVLGAARGDPWLGVTAGACTVAIHVVLARRRRQEARLVLEAALVGTFLDTMNERVGVLVFASGHVIPWLCPVWVPVLWAGFATTLRFSLGWLRRRWTLAALFGAVGGPAAFRAGEAMGAAVIAAPRVRSFLVLGLVWGVALPFLMRRAERSGSVEGEPPGYRGF